MAAVGSGLSSAPEGGAPAAASAEGAAWARWSRRRGPAGSWAHPRLPRDPARPEHGGLRCVGHGVCAADRRRAPSVGTRGDSVTSNTRVLWNRVERVAARRMTGRRQTRLCGQCRIDTRSTGTAGLASPTLGFALGLTRATGHVSMARGPHGAAPVPEKVLLPPPVPPAPAPANPGSVPAPQCCLSRDVTELGSSEHSFKQGLSRECPLSPQGFKGTAF